MKFTFPKNFLFGLASSAVQIESATTVNGKGEDSWQHFCIANPEKYGHSNLENGADFYHRYKEDIKLMKELGLRAFRFSISWSRIYPNGPDYICKEAIQHYHDLFDELIKNDIVPFIDLYHCDLPYWIVEKGGTRIPEFIDWFVEYARTCFTEYGDKIPYWSTVNEPQCNIMAPYAWGIPPYFEKNVAYHLQASHNMVIAHFKIVKLYREMGFKGKIGFVNHFQLAYGDTLDPKDQDAAERDMSFYSNWWPDAIFLGHYPENLMEYPYIRDNMPKDYQKDLDENFIKSDFVGVNYYGAYYVKHVEDDKMNYEVIYSKGNDIDDYGFSVNPQGMLDTLMYVHERYPDIELVISENGLGKKKWGNYEEELNDDFRIDYMREHLRGVSRAIKIGLPVTGYYHWTFLDTSEGITNGFSIMFGLVQIRFDREDKTRIPRKSFHYYKRVIEQNEVE